MGTRRTRISQMCTDSVSWSLLFAGAHPFLSDLSAASAFPLRSHRAGDSGLKVMPEGHSFFLLVHFFQQSVNVLYKPLNLLKISAIAK